MNWTLNITEFVIIVLDRIRLLWLHKKTFVEKMSRCLYSIMHIAKLGTKILVITKSR